MRISQLLDCAREVLVLYRKRASSEGGRGRMALWRAFDKATWGRPPGRRTRVLWKLNGGRSWCGDAPELCGGAQLITRRVRKVAGARKCREAIHRESRKKRLVQRQGEPRRSVAKHVQFSGCAELFHAAAVSRGGARSCNSAAVSLWTTTIGPAHLGQSQRSLQPWVPEVSCSVCGAEPSN